MPIFEMTKFVKCEWELKCNLYTPKCTYEHLKLNIFFGGNTPDPPCGRGTTPPAPSPSTAFGRAWVAVRPIVRTPNCPPLFQNVPTLLVISMFSRFVYPMELLGMLYDFTGNKKSNMAASKAGYTCISACRQDRNEIYGYIQIQWD